jgi:hypothetical protein
MRSALHITTTIQAGNRIELQIPDAGIGDTVEVFVILTDKSLPAKQKSILTLIDTIHSQQPVRTAAEIENTQAELENTMTPGGYITEAFDRVLGEIDRVKAQNLELKAMIGEQNGKIDAILRSIPGLGNL